MTFDLELLCLTLNYCDPQQSTKHVNFLLTSEVNISETVAGRAKVINSHIYDFIYEHGDL